MKKTALASLLTLAVILAIPPRSSAQTSLPSQEPQPSQGVLSRPSSQSARSRQPTSQSEQSQQSQQQSSSQDAQPQRSSQSPYRPVSLSTPPTETNHSFSAGLFGLYYGWEFPVGRLSTVVIRPGVQLGIARMDGFGSSKETYHALLATIDIEPRVYYNRDNRAARRKSMEGNQGNFLAVQVKTVPPFCIASDIDDPRVIGVTAISPMWGMCRVWGGHCMFELSGGPSLRVAWRGGRVSFLPNVNARIGYSF